MTFDITQVPITAKLMILRGGCENFRSVGKEMIFNYAENKSTVVLAEMNGAGKSTLVEHLPLYALTGRTSSTSDKVDSLINSTVGKNMVVWLEWYFAGAYYKVMRGRKPNLFDLFSLVNDNWVEIPNLPVSSTDRQSFMYSILGLDRKTAVNVLENTVLLSGQRFKGFSSLTALERRDLIEPILDLSIFSSLNAETKLLRSSVVTEQKQTFLEVTDANLQVALVGQTVEHKKQEINTLVASYEERVEVLNEKLSKCIADIKLVSEVDTSGLDLIEAYGKEHYMLCFEIESLKNKLESDIEALGVFEIDVNDKVLVKLNNNLLSLDIDLDTAKKALEDKRDTLDGEIVTIISSTNKNIEVEVSRYNEEVLTLQKENDERLEKSKKLVDDTGLILDKETLIYRESVELHKQGEANVLSSTMNLESALVKEAQYKEKCQKLLEAAVYLNVKKEQEESNLSGLLHAGECHTCKQNISEAYLEGLKETLNINISKLEADISIYKERIAAGESKVSELQVYVLREILSAAILNRDQVKPNDTALQEAKRSLQSATESLEFDIKYDCTERITNTHNTKMYQLNSILSNAGRQVKDILGDLESNYNQLVKSTPSNKENILQQIEDRKISLRGEHSGKEVNLRGVCSYAVDNIRYKIKCIDGKLEGDLKALVTDKAESLDLLNKTKVSIEDDIKTLYNSHNIKLDDLQKTYAEALTKQSCKVTDMLELNKKYDKQQQDIEDYNDLLLLLSDKEGKGDIIKNYIPKINKDVNGYLEALGMFISVEIDNEFNITMNSEDRKGQSLFSLSAGQKSKLDLSILLTLRDLASSKESVNFSLLVLDEILEPFSAEALQDVVLMLQERFKDNNIILITQRGDEVKDLFQSVKYYALRGGFTVELDNNN